LDLNYYRTLIAVADDCPVTSSVVPAARGAAKTVAVLQYEMLAEHPYGLTQEDVLFESWLRRQDLPDDQSEADRAALRARFFAKPQACLRSSPLPKRHGWGLLFDQHGKIVLCPMESEEYKRLVGGHETGVTVLKALRSRRA
jgi:Family of unknown function (DUF6157)